MSTTPSPIKSDDKADAKTTPAKKKENAPSVFQDHNGTYRIKDADDLGDAGLSFLTDQEAKDYLGK